MKQRSLMSRPSKILAAFSVVLLGLLPRLSTQTRDAAESPPDQVPPPLKRLQASSSLQDYSGNSWATGSVKQCLVVTERALEFEHGAMVRGALKCVLRDIYRSPNLESDERTGNPCCN